MSAPAFLEALADMSSAEDFLNYFEITFNQKVVEVNRLHILKRFQDYLEETHALDQADYAECLQRAYQDFVESDALTEKVFAVFHRQEKQREVRIPLTSIGHAT